MTASVAVVIPCYNYGRFLAEAIESVLSQTVLPAEIMVVEGGDRQREGQEFARAQTWGRLAKEHEQVYRALKS